MSIANSGQNLRLLRAVVTNYKDDSFDISSWTLVSGSATTNGDEFTLNGITTVTTTNTVTSCAGLFLKAYASTPDRVQVTLGSATAVTISMTTSYNVYEVTSFSGLTLPFTTVSIASQNASVVYTIDYIAIESGIEHDYPTIDFQTQLQHQLADITIPNNFDVLQQLGYGAPHASYSMSNLTYSDVSFLLNSLSANLPFAFITPTQSYTGYINKVDVHKEAGWPIYTAVTAITKGDGTYGSKTH